MKRLLQNWLTEQAAIRPDAPAIVYKNNKLTYFELESESNRLARLLQDSGCHQGDRVCMLIPKSPEAILSIFGILKADCIYVPLDPDGPELRTAKMIRKAQPKCILYSGSLEKKLVRIFAANGLHSDIVIGRANYNSMLLPHNLHPDFTLGDLHSCPDARPSYKNTPNAPASILFTSGSTGEPKGVINTHKNVIHFIDWAREYFKIDSSDRLSGHPPLHFDISSLDIYCSISSGSELHIVPPELNISARFLAEFIRQQKLTQWFSVPSALNLMAKFDVMNGNFPELRRILWCGEVLPASSLIYLMKNLPDVTCTNLYGPTETTIASSYYTVLQCPAKETDSIPIGRPCPGETLHVLDDQLQPLPTGEIGHLYIAGAGVGLGYWEDREKTEKVFIPNPFSSSNADWLYKTGDLARKDDSGLFWFHGREDAQIKSRGYRIETGEIENAIDSLKKTTECAVVGIPSDNFDGTAICCAFVPVKETNAKTLHKELRRFLPDYMIPTKWRKFNRLPKNKNGKIDRKEIKTRFAENEVKVG